MNELVQKDAWLSEVHNFQYEQLKQGNTHFFPPAMPIKLIASFQYCMYFINWGVFVVNL